MKHSSGMVYRMVVLLIVTSILLVACGSQPAAAPAEEGGEQITQVGKIGGSDRADQEYVWISQFSNLPLFVERVYPGLDAFARDFGVTVRKAGPTTVDLAAYIATVEQECARGPAGIIVVGGWDPALTEPVNKCIEMKVPVVVTDGDLFQSNRLSYVGTDWYHLGVVMAEAQIREHEALGLTAGQVAVISPIQNENMQLSRQGIKDTLAGTGIEVVAEEDNDSQADIAAQKTAALMAAYPDLTGMIGLDSEAGPGIIAALDEAGRSGEMIVTVNEAGREFLENIQLGKVHLITMENYDIMNYLALFLLYTYHNDAIRTAGLDPWINNWMPQSVDSGLVLVTEDTVGDVMQFMLEAEEKSASEE
ncbi:MAG: substrate-binding domain-containing protein [Anaerolineales bacterium]|nr:substrate-binding domain-containing protein [Anaerolineales bacterium]